MSFPGVILVALFGRPEKGVTVWLGPHELQATGGPDFRRFAAETVASLQAKSPFHGFPLHAFRAAGINPSA